MIKEIFKEKLNVLTFNFLILVTEKQRESLILDIIEQYEKQYNKVKNRLPVIITSAFELNSNNKDKVENRLHDITGKEILSEYELDKNLKGGITVRIDDWVYDASVRHQLELLYSELTEGRKASML